LILAIIGIHARKQSLSRDPVEFGECYGYECAELPSN